MASPANAPMMAQLPQLPANFGSQQAQEMYQKYLAMKKQGVRDDDPELIKIRQILTAVKHAQNLAQKQKAHQEQTRRMAHQNASDPAISNGTNPTNGQVINTAKPDGTPSTPLASATPKPTTNTSNGLNNFTTEQMNTLRTQILAFKVLTKNLPLPEQVQKQLFTTAKNTPPPPSPASGAKSQVQDNSSTVVKKSASQAPPAPEVRHWYSSFKSPYDLLPKSGRISYAEHSLRSKRPIIPSLMPVGVDADRVREERDRIVYNRIKARQAELEALPRGIATWDSSKSTTPVPDDNIRLKALIELKKLRLLGKQKELRLKVSRDMLHSDYLAQTANRTIYRRHKKVTIREARITENLEKKQRDARETSEKRRQIEQMQAILEHGKQVHENAQAQRLRAQKLGRLMQNHHQHIEKEEQKRIERTAKQRLQALKNDDEATYLKLLGQAKDSRISHLLGQTDGFLKQLAASVKEQQRAAVDSYGGGEEDMPEEDYSEGDDEATGKVDYYQVAHRIKEEVTAQANILVGGTLKEYQIKGLQWMLSLYNNNLNGILADEMGLGKTIQTISLVTYLIEKKKQNGPYLVIVPLSTLTNWTLEFEKWAPSLTKVVYKGPPNARKQQQQQIRYGQFQVLLTTYEYIIKDRPVLSKIKWLHMIIDEGHRMKNSQSKLTATLTQYYHTRYRLILTGTPLQNNLPELWALLNFVLPTIFKSVKSFDEWFNTPFANTGGQDRIELTEEEQLLVIRRLHKVLRPFLLRRLKKDVEKDLPDKTERVVKCKFSALQAKLYKQLVTHSQISVSDGKGGKVGMRGLTNMLMQLRKLCNHPFVFEQVEDQMNPDRMTNDMIWRTAGKFELLDRVLPKFKATGHRVLMFFQMTQIMNIMEDFLRFRGLPYLRLDGSTKSDERSDLLRDFNAPDSPYFCFLLSTRAGGLGLNLQTADTVIIYDSDWNPHQDLQAQDRAHRIGQKNEVRILRLISSSSVEEKILERARYKLDMDDKVIQAGKFDNKSTNEERENLLRTLLDATETMDTSGNTQEEMDDDELNEQMARSEEEIVIFQKMDAERHANTQYGPGKKLGRLMEESELPDIYMNEESPVVEDVVEYAGRGARERTKIKYDDGLTEEQWLNAVDDDEDTIEDAIARKNARIEKRHANKSGRDKDDESSPEPSHHSSPELPPQKKRGRKSGGPVKRKAEEEVEQTPPAKKKRGRITKTIETLAQPDRVAFQAILDEVFQVLMDLEEPAPESDNEGDQLGARPIIDPFLKLVPRNHYPDYYMIIPQPIAMDTIEKRINKHEYQNTKDFMADVRLLCNNARTYNEDGSPLYLDANLIEKTAFDKLRELTADKPKFQDFDDQNGTADGTSTAAASVPGTPLPSSTGGTKLKLTFNAGDKAPAAASAEAPADDDDPK